MNEQIDRGIHPDIHAMTCPDEVVSAIVASCGCLTKTPQPRYHARDCRYKHLAHRLEELRPSA